MLENISTGEEVFVLGLGYVGLTLAVALADVGFRVTGVEKKSDVVTQLKRGEPHFFEKGLAAKLAEVVRREQLVIQTALSRDSSKPATFIVTVGTPLNDEGIARLDMITDISTQIASILEPGDLVVLRSTLKIGTTKQVVVPILENAGCAFDLAFCPERTLEGDALNELRKNPQIIGGVSNQSVDRAVRLFKRLCPTTVVVSSVDTAEMIKLVDNSQRDSWFAYANEVAMACDLVGISAPEVISAGKLGYPRTNVAWPGPAGGPCLEKDPHILNERLVELGKGSQLIGMSRQVNKDVIDHACRFICDWIVKNELDLTSLRVGVLGVAFKGHPATNDVRGSAYFDIVDKLTGAGICLRNIVGFDPNMAVDEITDLGISAAEDISTVFRDASLILVVNNNPAFGDLPIIDLSSLMSAPGLIYDFWNNYWDRNLVLSDQIKYSSLGNHLTAR